jgi:hypothetical protein
MKMLKTLVCLTVCFSISIASAGVKLTPGKDTVEITINGKQFTTFNYGSKLPKPFMSPVKRDGKVLTRPIYFNRKQGDHPHHKGIWVAVDEVGGVKFWAEQGQIETKSVKLLKAEGNPAQLEAINEWQGPDGKAIVVETTTISVFENGLLAYDIRFKAAGDERVEFGDTKEGLFGFRMAHSMRESEGGTVVNSNGEKGSKISWGNAYDWIDYYGPVDGQTYGAAIFDHPLNLRRSRFHVRNYGLFSINPFGEKAYSGGRRPAEPYYLDPSGTLRLRYGLFIHSGTTEEAKVGEVYKSYLKSGH